MITRLRARAGMESGSRGFTIIEVVVAAMLLMIAMAGFVPFFLSGLSQASAVRYKSLATNVARDRMEKVRRLDYREISTPEELAQRFGATAVVDSENRSLTFNVDYDVDEEPYEAGTLKKVTVNVNWTGNPVGSTAAITTLVHQQFLGPRGSLLEIIPLRRDPLGTPFPRIDGPTIARYHIAKADWGLVIDNLDQEGMVARNVYMRVAFFDNDRHAFPDEDIQVTALYYTLDATGKVNDVYFEYQFDSSLVPDGYWEMRTIAYNEYNEPGNVWRLRVRVEDGPPDVPELFSATPGDDNQSVLLTWYGAGERDRAYYVIERRTYDIVEETWPDTWQVIASNLDPKSITYLDQGVVNVSDPWGAAETPNRYQYRLHAVDICQPGLVGWATQTETIIPSEAPVPVTTTSTTSTTSTTIPLSSGDVVNNSNKAYTITVKDNAGNPVHTASVAKKSTVTITGLPAGDYLITATSSGKPTLTQTFAMPEQNDQTLLTIF